MTTTRLGRTDLFVHPIGLGANAIGGHNIYANIDEEVSKKQIHTAIDHGMNFIDTAYFYGLGRSEELIGEVMKEHGKRDDFVIASKASYTFVDGKVVHVNDPEFLVQSVDESLRRLQTDYIDLFYVHFPDEHTPKYEAVGALQNLREAGKIRAIGVSNFSLEQLKEANRDGYVDVIQGHYNLFHREAEKEIFPYVTEHEISFVPYFPLAKGLLTGKYHKDTPLTEQQRKHPLFKEETYLTNVEKVDGLRRIAEEKNTEIGHLVLAWYLTRGPIDAVIPGAKTPEQILKNMRAAEVKLTEEEIEEINKIFQN
ncbi:aldo/keto reductase [Robertmurraya andreesenii]|uniref:Aryl-alcohol dehydrogenase-like predicted oxidoreductase n=1 Tax=Anoxybacillus andreesenii TaxID=1325932 RepID=A0ABT9V1X2_9BACL|nr:aldo/keto reductase [Robertmurraya andreesenii]MDQ0154860.1 aryl-alcohol dehydrogenase-like predicted oxidoreductase [Robertmurraya andreesenii]